MPVANRWMAPLLVLMIGSFMSVLDSSIVNAAIPTMQNELGTTPDDIAWVATAYTMALGVAVPISNFIGDRIGPTLAHRLSVIGFTVASALCGMAWDLDSMIVFRVLQAVPGGVLPVMTLNILFRLVPNESRGTAMGIYGLGVIVAPAIGPTVGGYFVDNLDWRLIFYVNVPVGIIAVALGLVLLPTLPRAAVRPFDWWGFLTIGYGLFAILLATAKGEDWRWTSYPILLLIVTGVISLALFVVIENEVKDPLIDLRVLRYWPYVNSLIMISVLMVGLFSVAFFMPQFLQEAQRFTAINSGLLMLPQALAMAAMMPLAGRVYDRIGPRWPVLIGLSLCTLGTYYLAGVNVDVTRRDVITWTMIRGFGTGLAMMPIMTNGLNWLPAELTAYGSALNTIVQRVSAALGVAAFGAMVQTQSAQIMADRGSLVQTSTQLPQVRAALANGTGLTGLGGIWQSAQLRTMALAYSEVFLVCAGLTAGCVLLAFRLRRPRIAADPPSGESAAVPVERAPSLAGAGRTVPEHA